MSAHLPFRITPFTATATLCVLALAFRILDPNLLERWTSAAPPPETPGAVEADEREPPFEEARQLIELPLSPGAGPEDDAPAETGAADERGGDGDAAARGDGWMSSDDFATAGEFPESDLARRLRAIEEREAKVELREQAQDRLRAALDRQIERLETLKAEVEALLEGLDEEDEQRIQSLAQVYSRMKPKAAAAVFEQLDTTLLVQLFRRMQETKSAPILAAISPERAREITAALAEGREPASR